MAFRPWKEPKLHVPPERTYLDALPDDALRRIARHLSSRPYSHHWAGKNMHPRAVLTMLELGGAFARVIKQDVVALSMFRPADDASLLLIRGDTVRLSVPLVQYLAASLRSVGICSFAPTSLLVMCVVLRELDVSVDDDGELFDTVAALRAHGHRLRTLCFRSPFSRHRLSRNVTTAIAEHCTSLQWLELRAVGCDGSLVAAWKSVGDTLERLSLSLDDTTCLAPVEAGNHLRKLARVDILNSDKAGRMRKFLQIIGYRLRIFTASEYFFACNLSDLSDLVEHCPNAVVHAETGQFCTALIEKLGARLQKLRLNVPVARMANVNFAVLRRCSNLYHLQIAGRAFMYDGLDVLKMVDKHNLPLRSVECDKVESSEKAKELFKILSRICSLECIEVKLHKQLCKESLKLLGNVNQLKTLRVFLRAGSRIFPIGEENKMLSGDVTELCELVGAVAGSARLNELTIHNSHIKGRYARIAELCRKLVRRRADVFICGHSYT